MITLLKRVLDEAITTDRLAEALRPHSNDLSSSEIQRVATVLEQFICSVPDALGWAIALSKDPQGGRSVAFATGSILNYVFDEEDLLPEASFGDLGFLDDAYLVHVFAAMLAQTYPFAEPAADYSAPDDRAFEVVASLLPQGVAQALRRTCESTIQVAQALFLPGQLDGTAESTIAPHIRVDEAARLASDSSSTG
jgi:hypothetical protein